jgi:phosphate transport system substrate-binding protein
VSIGYSAVGSSAGIAAISAGQIDFGASDVPMTAAEQAAAKGGEITQVPVALGGEGVVYNLSLPAGSRLHLTGPVLAAIFLGKVTRWTDPAITALNPGLSLPPAPINVVHRSDGSGTTYIFSNYLSSVDPAWAAKVGTGKTLRWPAGEGAEGNGGVAAAVNRTSFSIGYVEQAYSQGLLLPFAAIRNPAGRYVIPSTQTVAAGAAQKPGITPADFSIANQPGAASYPISGVQLGAGLHPPAQPGHRPRPGHHAGLAHSRRPGLRRRQRLRTPPSPDPAARPDHAPADHRPNRNTPAELAGRAQLRLPH